LIIVYRYRAAKRNDGHFSFDLHAGASVLGYSEYWNSEKGWEILIDVLSDTNLPMERRDFFLCGTGTTLDPLGEDASLHFIDTFEAKGYISYLFETSHLPLTQREKLDAKWKPRPAPRVEDMGRQQRKYARPQAVEQR
jgi:hypothetical protein